MKSRQVTRENRTADCQQSALNETKYRYANGVITPPKQQIYESSSDNMININTLTFECHF
jgi:hypothetical protein